MSSSRGLLCMCCGFREAEGVLIGKKHGEEWVLGFVCIRCFSSPHLFFKEKRYELPKLVVQLSLAGALIGDTR